MCIVIHQPTMPDIRVKEINISCHVKIKIIKLPYRNKSRHTPLVPVDAYRGNRPTRYTKTSGFRLRYGQHDQHDPR